MTENYEGQHNYVEDPHKMMHGVEPLAHLKKFLHFIDTVKVNNVLMNTIYLRLFSFSLADRVLKYPHHDFLRGTTDPNFLQRSLHPDI
ncbi:hypothetical protein CR513_06749, partial [Mucuna pruriens]